MNSSAPKDSEGLNGRELVVSLVLLLLFWILISLPPVLFSPQGINGLWQHILVGVPLAYLVTRLTRYPIFTSTEIDAHRLPNLLRLILYIFFLITQIFIGGIDVARRVMRFTPDISPGFIKFRTPLRGDLPIILNANSITLTPGTITVDVEQDEKGSTFWVHSISKEGLESMKTDKGFVEKILNVYRK